MHHAFLLCSIFLGSIVPVRIISLVWKGDEIWAFFVYWVTVVIFQPPVIYPWANNLSIKFTVDVISHPGIVVLVIGDVISSTVEDEHVKFSTAHHCKVECENQVDKQPLVQK